MKLDRIRMRGITTAFRDSTIDFDFRDLRGICAVVGPNGAGKTTFVGSMGAALYGAMPDGQSVDAIAVGQDPYIEATYTVNKRTFSIRQDMAGRGTAVVTGADGEPLAKAGRKALKAWVAKHLPGSEQFYSSQFSRLDSRGFVDLAPLARSEVVMKALGLDVVKLYAKAAGKAADEAATDLRVTNGLISGEKPRCTPLVELDLTIASLAVRSADMDMELRRLQQAVATHERLTAERGEAERRRVAALEQVAVADRRLATNAATLCNLEAQLDGLGATMAEGESIRAAVRECATIARSMRELEDVRARHDAKRAELTAEHVARSAEAEPLKSSLERVSADFDALERQHRGLEVVVEAAVAGLAAAEAEEARAAKACSDGARRIEDLRERLKHAKDARIATFRVAVATVAADAESGRFEGVAATLRAVLANDDAAQQEAAELPSQEAALLTTHATNERTHASAQKLASAARAGAARESELDTITDALKGASEALGAAEEAARAATVKRTRAANALAEHEATAKVTAIELARLRARRDDLATLASRDGELVAAESTRAHILAQVAQIKVARNELAAERGAIIVPPPVGPPPAVGPSASAIEAAQRDVDRVRADVIRATTERDAAMAAHGRLADLLATSSKHAQRVADLRILEAGLRAVEMLELEASGPALTECCNDLLSGCLGGRFSARFETKKANKTNGGERDGCWVFINDALSSDSERDAQFFSGGEKSLIAEAINLAVMSLGCRDEDEPTIVRDETAGLDSANAPAYVAMLRRAAERVNSPLVMFITHDPVLQAMADHRIVVDGGSVRLRGREG